MRELIKSMARFSWSMSLFGIKTLADLLTPRSGTDRPETAAALDAVTDASVEELGSLRPVYETGERVQSEVVDRVFDAVSGRWEGGRGGFDTSRFVVLGDGLAAGMGHFALEGSAQSTSFPALLARALATPFEQPLVQPPGLGEVIGLDPRALVVPDVRQSTVLHSLPATAGLGNLSIPGFGVADALSRRPRAPLVDRRSSLGTLTNFILGLPELMHGPGPGPTQLEYARSRRPTLALVCYGYDEVLRAAVDGDPCRLPARSTFEADVRRLLQGLGRDPLVVVTTLPDPLDSAYFSSPEQAAAILKTTPRFLEEQWGVGAGDLVHLKGLYAMGYQTMGRKVGRLESRPVIDRETVRCVRHAVAELNSAIESAAEHAGARVFDLHGLVADLAGTGVEVAGRRLATSYLGGLFLLNGAYPGATLNAWIAAAMVRWINLEFDQAFDEPSVEAVAAADANVLTELAPGGPSTDAFLEPRTAGEIPDVAPLPDSVREMPIQTTYPQLQPGKEGCTPAVGIPAAGFADPSFDNPGWKPLEIPAGGLEYTLEVNPESSYFGDALRPVDCPNDPAFIPGLPPFGLCENTFFGGFLPTTSPLHGKIHVKFSPPANGVTRFEIRHPGGLHGDEGDLAGPQLFRMPVQHTVVRDIERLVSSGELHLASGWVTNFHYNVQNMNTALCSLLKLNPGTALPALEAAALTFPGLPNAGSSWAEFTPRGDGKLDVSLAGHMFVPFGLEAGGRPVRFALPFTTPDLDAASFVARGTSLHPRIFLTTRSSPPAGESARVPELPYDTVQEFTSFSHNTCFGDAFDLHAPELGEGGATGRSQLMSRVRVQFGSKTANTVPVVFQVLPPGGLLSDAPAPPPFLPPGLSRAEIGFDTVLHFPKQTYPQSGLSSPDDPFNICATSVDVRTGRMVSPLLWRGYVVQALFGELIQVEPCTPADSFNYQGPASFERGKGGELVLRWNGTVFLPYPKGFKFPSSNPGGRPAIVIQGDSRLDPFRCVQAMRQRRGAHWHGEMSGDVRHARSPSTGAEFAYRYRIPCDPAHAHEAMFEYTDVAREAHFRLTSLSWVDFGHSRGSTSGADRPDFVTFGGFGTWSADESGAPHQVSVQISVAEGAPYVGILVDGGATSNVDVKPAEFQPA